MVNTMFDFDVQRLMIWAPVVILSLTVHEFLHAWAAVRCGDPTPEMEGRLTLNPLAHLDLIGTLMILFAPIGWARPVPVNFLNLRRPRLDGILVSIAGVCGNLALAVGFFLLIAVLGVAGAWKSLPASIEAWQATGYMKTRPVLLLQLLTTGVLTNTGLLMFNLLPLHPLDGSKVLSFLLPVQLAEKYDRLAPVGPILLIIVALSGIFAYVLLPAMLLVVVLGLLCGIDGSVLLHLLSF